MERADPSGPLRAPEPKGTVLIVDDDPVLCEFVSMALAEQGYQTVTAGDGMRALELVTERVPAAVILDVGMPLLGGTDLAERIRELCGVAVPCIVMSGSPPPADDMQDSAVCGYLAKPFDIDELFRLVERHARVEPAPVP